jgi:site-specific DNA-methyltransferase (adenine-specific)
MIDLRLGDCIEILKTLPDNSVDSIVTDPPYGIGFMGKAWDTFDPTNVKEAVIGAEQSYKKTKDDKQENPNLKGRKNAPIGSKSTFAGTYDLTNKGKNDYQQFCYEWGKECFRILKPGGHLLASNSPRMYHRMAIGLEDAGFEVRDQIMWVYGSGFPKSHNIGKAIDKMGIDNEWEGWGTALKPAHEPICMARKPLSEKTIAENVLKHGTGGINIDDCRISYIDDYDKKHQEDIRKGTGTFFGGNGESKSEQIDMEGRFPANIIFDEEAGKILDQQSGISKSTGSVRKKDTETDPSNMDFKHKEGENSNPYAGQSGGASRFFYCPKVSKKERNAGLEDFEEKTDRQKGHGLDRRCGNCGTSMLKPQDCKCENPDWITPPKKNHHPTVKPIALMEYLIKLVTPKGGVVLEPFMGSGSTGIAAKNLGMSFIGIEREEEYFEIAKQRINKN